MDWHWRQFGWLSGVREKVSSSQNPLPNRCIQSSATLAAATTSAVRLSAAVILPPNPLGLVSGEVVALPGGFVKPTGQVIGIPGKSVRSSVTTVSQSGAPVAQTGDVVCQPWIAVQSSWTAVSQSLNLIGSHSDAVLQSSGVNCSSFRPDFSKIRKKKQSARS